MSALLLALLLALASGCSREPPEQALRATIAAMQAGAEARDGDAVMAGFAEDFIGPNGMDRDGFRRYLALLLLRNREVGVVLGPLRVEMLGDRATVRFTAATRGGAGLLPDQARVHEVETGWRLDDDEWRLVAASWQPVL